MKYIMLFIITLQTFILFAGCAPRDEKKNDVDLLTKYSINDLQGLFEAIYEPQPPEQEDRTVFSFKKVIIDDAAAEFPSSCMRRLPSKNGEFIYTVYNVKEGGRYYVRWNSADEGILECVDRIYLKDLPSERELKKVKKGDPYSKLEKTDENCRFVYRMASYPIAYSLASNGKVYGFTLIAGDDNEYRIAAIQDCSDSEIFLSMIIKADYP